MKAAITEQAQPIAQAAPSQPTPRPLATRLLDYSVAVVWAVFASASLLGILHGGGMVDAGRFVFNTLVVLAFVFRRPAVRTGEAWDTALAWFGATILPMVGLKPVDHGLAWLGVSLQVLGLLGMIASMLSLGRSFGVAPADRGLVRSKLYGWVRHPLYASELVFSAGYLLANLSWRNALVCAVIAVVQVVRLLREEKVIDGYDSYQAQVRWRLIPYVW